MEVSTGLMLVFKTIATQKYSATRDGDNCFMYGYDHQPIPP